METERFRLVFHGELAYGFTPAEVKDNLCRLFRCDAATIERLFARVPATIKQDLTREVAERYRAAMQEAGAVCSIEPLATAEALAPPPAPAAVAEQAGAAAPTPFRCPACGQDQDAGLVCRSCGIVFAKYEQAQERKREAALLGISEAELLRRQKVAAQGEPVPPGLAGYFAQHQEQAFLLKAILTIVVILSLQQFLSSGLLFLFFILFPLLFILYVRMQALADGRSPSDALSEHITLMPVMYTDGERRQEGVAWVTYALIAINLFTFYAIEMQVDGKFLVENFLFLPEQPNLWNVPISAVTAQFLHASGGHLWGNMLFLWAIGTVVERRIGHWRFLATYLACGVVAGLFGSLIHWLFMDDILHGLGASGAIAGVMGVFAVRCYFKSMVFPLPILGIFSLILPVSLKVRLNSLVVIGLFFLSDLSGGIAQASGENTSMVGHWIHIGGMAGGVVLAFLFKLGSAAIEERHLERGASAAAGDKKINIGDGEESLRLVLRANPDNTEALLHLARIVSRYHLTDEGRDLYRRAIALLITTQPKEALKVHREFYAKYLAAVSPTAQYRLAGLYYQEHDLDMAGRTLELLIKDGQTPVATREKAMFQYARVLDDQGLAAPAREHYRAFVDAFPASPHLAKAQARLAAL